MRAVFGEGDAEVEHGVVALEARQVHVSQRDGGYFAAADEVGEGHRGCEGEVFQVGRGGERRRSFGVDGLFALGVKGRAGRERIEDESRSDGVGQMQLADGFVAGALLIESVEHGGFVFVGDDDAGESCGLVDHRGRDFGELRRCRFGGVLRVLGLGIGRGLRGEGIENAGEEGGGEAKAAGDVEELATIHCSRVQGAGCGVQDGS